MASREGRPFGPGLPALSGVVRLSLTTPSESRGVEGWFFDNRRRAPARRLRLCPSASLGAGSGQAGGTTTSARWRGKAARWPLAFAWLRLPSDSLRLLASPSVNLRQPPSTSVDLRDTSIYRHSHAIRRGSSAASRFHPTLSGCFRRDPARSDATPAPLAFLTLPGRSPMLLMHAWEA